MHVNRKIWLLGALAWVAFATTASAHGLLARVRTEGSAVVGTAYYSSGEPAGGEWVQVFDATARGAKVAEFSAGADGSFRFEGTPGHEYRLVIHGDEGHFIELSIAIRAGARARLVEDRVAPAGSGLAELPAWLIVGVTLAAVSLLALFHRAKEAVRGRKAAERMGVRP